MRNVETWIERLPKNMCHCQNVLGESLIKLKLCKRNSKEKLYIRRTEDDTGQ